MQAIWQVPLWAAAILGGMGSAVLLAGIGTLLWVAGRHARNRPPGR